MPRPLPPHFSKEPAVPLLQRLNKGIVQKLNRQHYLWGTAVIVALVSVFWSAYIIKKGKWSLLDLIPIGISRGNNSPSGYYVANNGVYSQFKQDFIDLSIEDISGKEIWKARRFLAEGDKEPWVDQGFGEMQFILWSKDSSYVIFEVENAKLLKVDLTSSPCSVELLSTFPINDVVYVKVSHRDDYREPSPPVKLRYSLVPPYQIDPTYEQMLVPYQ